MIQLYGTNACSVASDAPSRVGQHQIGRATDDTECGGDSPTRAQLRVQLASQSRIVETTPGSDPVLLYTYIQWFVCTRISRSPCPARARRTGGSRPNAKVRRRERGGGHRPRRRAGWCRLNRRIHQIVRLYRDVAGAGPVLLLLSGDQMARRDS